MPRSHGEPLSGTTAAAILVGGASRRLGETKALVEVGGVPLVERVRRAAAAVASEVVLVGKEGMPNLLTGVELVTERYPVPCALAGVVAALKRFPDRPVLVLACDLPFLEPAVLCRLVERSAIAPVTLPVVHGRPEPLVAVYRPAALGPLSTALSRGELKIQASLARLECELVPFKELQELDPAGKTFLNVNDRGDLMAARRRADGG